MTVEEAIGKWSEGCTAEDANGQLIRNGNWQPIERALRHCKGGAVAEHKQKLNGDTVIVVTPKESKPAEGKSPMTLPPFLLVVK